MVKKPGRRKESRKNVMVIAVVVLGVLIAGAVGYYVYGASTVKQPPIQARIVTSLGSFDVVLYPASAPETVANFVNLTKSGFFNNLVWHRIVSGFVVQTGDPLSRGGVNSTRSSWGTGTSGRSVPFEYDPSLNNYRGYLAMASSSPKSGGTSQFFINLVDNTSLDGDYSVFGKVVDDSGMAIVDKIANVPVYTAAQVGSGSHLLNQPITPVYVISITILESA